MTTIIKEFITPIIAKNYLQNNPINRRLKPAVIARYAKDMESGRWRTDTGETIKIASTGELIDGQHRLLAVIKSNTPIEFEVKKGMDRSVFSILDTGSIRNATDVFKIAGVSNSNTVPSVISMYNLLRLAKKSKFQKSNKYTNDELLEQYFENEEWWQNVVRKTGAWYIKFEKVITPSLIGGFYSYLSQIDQAKADDFMTQLCEPGMCTSNPIQHLKIKLLNDKYAPRKMGQPMKIAYIIKTWNYYIENQKIKILKFDPTREEYPVIMSIPNQLKFEK